MPLLHLKLGGMAADISTSFRLADGVHRYAKGSGPPKQLTHAPGEAVPGSLLLGA